MPSLKHLNLAHNSIKTIDITSLEQLKSLNTLDLKKNVIRTLAPNTFPVENSLTKL